MAEKKKRSKTERIDKLNSRHLAFIDEYIVNGLNGTQAYLKVYRCKMQTALANSAKLLGNANIKEELNKRLTSSAEKMGITRERLLKSMGNIAFGDITHIVDKIKLKIDKETMEFTYDMSELTPQERKLIKSIEVDSKQGKVKITGYSAENMQIKLYEMLGYKEAEKVEHSGDLSINWIEELTEKPES
jgi:phage terminase small subunit